MKVLVTLPNRLVKELDDIAEELDLDRSEVIEELCSYVLDNEELLDEVFPKEEEEGEGGE